MKPGEFFVMFLWAIWGVAPAQNLVKYKRCLSVLIRLTKKKHCDYVIYAWSMIIEQKIYRVKNLPVSLLLRYLPAFLTISLLTMVQLCAFVNKMGPAASLRFPPSVKRI